MASGHVNRANRPNTWLHRPRLRREDSPCQLGAVSSISSSPDTGDRPKLPVIAPQKLRGMLISRRGNVGKRIQGLPVTVRKLL
jgi:hypothetical protein